MISLDVDYSTLMLRIDRGLPTSTEATSELVDFLRPEPFGVTLPRLAVALIPNANNRKPSFRTLVAAFTSKAGAHP